MTTIKNKQTINTMETTELHNEPYKGTNNRKMTSARRKAATDKIQSIPVWERNKFGEKVKFLGYKYIKNK